MQSIIGDPCGVIADLSMVQYDELSGPVPSDKPTHGVMNHPLPTSPDPRRLLGSRVPLPLPQQLDMHKLPCNFILPQGSTIGLAGCIIRKDSSRIDNRIQFLSMDTASNYVAYMSSSSHNRSLTRFGCSAKLNKADR